MSSTNKTTNYELSQYVGSDKPTYLGDYNSDMLKIDTQMKSNADGVSTNASNISTVSATATEALGKANTNAENITTVTTTANSALSKANANEVAITGLEANTNVVTSETKIGKLGTKNLYRKIVTYTQNSSTASTGLVQIDIDTGITGLTRLYNIFGAYDVTGNQNYNAPLPNFTTTGGQLSINSLQYANNNFIIRLRAYNHAISSGTEFEFIIEYTKD